MKQLRQPAALAFGTTVLLSLTSGLGSKAATKPAAFANTSNVDTIASFMVPNTAFLTETTGSKLLMAQVNGTLLSPEQTARLVRLPIPIVAPTYLPAGFRLVRAEGEAGKYVNGDDDSGYAIDYQGEHNTCLSVRSSQDGPRGLEKVKQVQTRFGLITVYTDKTRESKSLISFLGIKGNPILISGGTLPDSTAKGGFKLCRAVSVETYTQVLKSLTVMK